MRTQRLTVILSTLLALTFLPEYAHAQNKTLPIQLYKHQGCTPISGHSKVLPSYGHLGFELTFQHFADSYDAWGESHKCHLELTQKQKSCQLATQPSEYVPQEWKQTCVTQYQAEISPCRSHYEREKKKCDLLIPKTERKADDRDKMETAASRKPKHDASKSPQWEELLPSDTLPPGWEELIPEESYGHEPTCVGDGVGSKGNRTRGDLLANLKSKHQDAASGILNRKVEDQQRLNKENLPMGQAALQQGNANLAQSILNLDRWQSRSSVMPRPAAPGPRDSDSRCERIALQIAAKMETRFPSRPGNSLCAGGQNRLRMLTYAKDNLSRHQCYSGEYDQVIAETRNYIIQVCE